MDLNSTPWQSARLIPLLVVENAPDVLAVMEALLAGGISTFEIGLRTEAALPALELAAKSELGVVGAGTITSTELLRKAVDSGAQFGVSPALTESLAGAISEVNLPFIPGIGSAAEALRAHELGFSDLKAFPADLIGAEKFVRSMGSVLPRVRLMPSGGITEDNLESYFREPNVFAVSGSWLAPLNLIHERNFAEITRRATRAMELSR